jgi:hypothetical protein
VLCIGLVVSLNRLGTWRSPKGAGSVQAPLPRLPNCPYFIEKRSPFDDGCDEELELLENHLAAVRAKTIKRLKLVTGIELEPQDATHLDGD